MLANRYLTRLVRCNLWTVLCACVAASAQERVQFGTEPALTAYYYRAASVAPPAPVIVALHGCGGMLDRNKEPNERARSYAKLLNAQGWHVLAIDSLTPRHLKSVCGNTTDTLSPSARVPDVQAAVAWLVQQSGVDKTRIGILGWSHGGSLTLLANARGVDYAAQPKAAVAFYPGCGALSVPRHWQPAHPMLMQLGQDDDWTDPTPCQAWARQYPAQIAQDTYPDSGHGFDSEAPRRAMLLRAGTRTERTVHTGGNQGANAQARVRVVAFFQHHFSTPP